MGNAGSQTDEALALGVQQGNAENLTVLFDRHYSTLLAYLYRLCLGQRPLAEDLTQETFLRALRGIGSYQYPRPFKSWLYTIATNSARNHFNRADTRYTESVVEDYDLPDETQQPEVALLVDEEADEVLAALGQLADHQREVVLLFYYQGFAQQEIAEALGIPLGTVKSRLSLGLRRLREHIEQKERASC